MNIVDDPQTYLAHLSLVDEVFVAKARLPQLVFKQDFVSFRVLDFNYLLTRRGYRFMSEILGGDRFAFVVLVPDSENYFFKNFEKYGMLDGYFSDGEEEYIRALNEGMTGSPADALGINSDVVAICPEDRRWSIWAERDLDVAVVACSSDTLSRRIDDNIGELCLPLSKIEELDAVEWLMER